MEAKVTKNDETVSLSLSGDLTIYEAEAIKKGILDAVYQEGKNLEINLSEIDEIDACGIQVLMLAKRECEKLDKKMELVSHSSAVLEIIDVFHLAEYFGDPLLISNAKN